MLLETMMGLNRIEPEPQSNVTISSFGYCPLRLPLIGTQAECHSTVTTAVLGSHLRV